MDPNNSEFLDEIRKQRRVSYAELEKLPSVED